MMSSPNSPSPGLAGGGVQQRLLLKQTAIDTWSLKEQLGLASAVLRSGDQNWVSVSRQMKPFSDDGRPADWFSQKNCALQYNLLLNKVETPRRKRGEKAVESVETPGEAIVRRLTAERIRELRKVIETEALELKQLEEECKLLSDEGIKEDQLREIEAAIEREDIDLAQKKAAHEKWLGEREAKKQAILAALKAHSLKLPLKGAAAAAVQQAGAARRASTQSERSSFSDLDSPLNPVLPPEPEVPATEAKYESPLEPPASTVSPIKPAMEPNENLVHEENKAVDALPSNDQPILLKEPDQDENAPEKVLEEPLKSNPEAIKEESTEHVLEAPQEPEKAKKSLDTHPEVAVLVEDPVIEHQNLEASIKKEMEPLDDDLKKETKSIKKSSEVSEEDDLDDASLRSRRDTRSKKVSERSDEAEDSLPITSLRATRRSKKSDSTLEMQSAIADESASAVENKRLSRIRETESNRGRRASGATIVSRSSSPAGSGDESDTEPQQQQHSKGSSRKKPVRGLAEATDSTPPSPIPDEDENWKKSALSVVLELRTHKLSESVFPLLQGGSSVILKEVNLTHIKKKLESNLIGSGLEFQLALHHMFLNIVMTHSSDSEDYENAMNLYRESVSLVEEFQNLSQSLKSPLVARSTSKSREKRDSSHSGTSTPDDRRKRFANDDISNSNKRKKR